MNSVEIENLIDSLGPRLYRYFQHKGAGDASSDCVQDTFLRFLQKADRFDPLRGDSTAFIFGIAHHIYQENERKKRRWLWIFNRDLEESDDKIDQIDLQTELEERSRRRSLDEILKTFPKLLQDILYLHYDEELSTREISEALNVQESTVKSHLHRAREKLKSLLGEEYRNG